MQLQMYTKQCHAYRAGDGAYLGATLAYLDPATPGQYNLPAQTTWDDPASLGEWGYQWPFWNGDAWELRDKPQ